MQGNTGAPSIIRIFFHSTQALPYQRAHQLQHTDKVQDHSEEVIHNLPRCQQNVQEIMNINKGAMNALSTKSITGNLNLKRWNPLHSKLGGDTNHMIHLKCQRTIATMLSSCKMGEKICLDSNKFLVIEGSCSGYLWSRSSSPVPVAVVSASQPGVLASQLCRRWTCPNHLQND